MSCRNCGMKFNVSLLKSFKPSQMGCKNCGQGKAKYKTVCKACELVNGDTTEKPTYYCKQCGAYLCKDCLGNWMKRGVAAIIQFFKK